MERSGPRRVAWCVFLAIVLALAGHIACNIELVKPANNASGDDASADDASGDDAADDAGDDAGDDIGDDAGDDTTAPPTYPSNHDATWNCYICHDVAFNGAPGEPHGHVYNAPTDCVGCHQKGTWVNGPHGASAMNVGQNCLNCHSGLHGKPWQDLNQCMVCHQIGGGDDDKG